MLTSLLSSYLLELPTREIFCIHLRSCDFMHFTFEAARDLIFHLGGSLVLWEQNGDTERKFVESIRLAQYGLCSEILNFLPFPTLSFAISPPQTQVYHEVLNLKCTLSRLVPLLPCVFLFFAESFSEFPDISYASGALSAQLFPPLSSCFTFPGLRRLRRHFYA